MAHIIVAKVGGIVHKIGIQRHHHERDDLGADVAYGIYPDVFQKLRTSVSRYIVVVITAH